MANKLGNIVTALIWFVTGVAFFYFTYPFFNSLFTAFDAVGMSYDGWTTGKYIIWGGYWLVLILWILVAPLVKILGTDSMQNG